MTTWVISTIGTPLTSNIETLLASSKASLGCIEIELGCGPKKVSGRIGVDKLPLPGVDLVADLEDGLKAFPTHCADVIYARSVLEHVVNVGDLMTEIHRVLKPNGHFVAFVPHFSNPYFYSDYTHRTFFGLYSFFYFVAPEEQLRRKVPTFYGPTRFSVASLQLVFIGRGRVGKVLKSAFGKLINSSTRLQEFYEANLCYLIPCYAIEATLIPATAADAIDGGASV